jgi:hypothetical protein
MPPPLVIVPTHPDDIIEVYTSGSASVSVESAPDQGKPSSRRLEWSPFYPSAFESLAEKWREHLSALGEAHGGAIGDAEEKLLGEYDKEARKVLDPWPIYQHVFIPAGRAFFSQFEGNVFSVMKSGADLDPLYGGLRCLSRANERTLYLLNPVLRRVERVEVDNCVITEGPRCDWL